MKKRPILMGLWLGLCAFGSGLAGAATATLPPGAVLVAPEAWVHDEAQADRLAREVLARIARDEVDAALKLLHAERNPVRFEASAAFVIEALQAQAPNASAERVLAGLEREPVRVFQRHEETAADWFQPVFNIPARATSARELFAASLRRDALLAKLERDPKAAREAKEAPTLAAAIEKLSPTAVARLSAAALRNEVSLPSVAWAALSRRHPSAEVLDATLREATALDLLPLFEDLTMRLAPEAALAWLNKAAREPELASAAVMSLGVLAPRLPEAEAALAAHLGHPDTGASAAAALAQLAVPDRLKRIETWLTRADTSGQVNDLALALRLEGSPAAQQRLRDLTDDPRLSPTLRKELQR